MTDYAALVAALRENARYGDGTDLRRAADALEALTSSTAHCYHGERMRAERDAALARIAAVEALCEQMDGRPNSHGLEVLAVSVIRAALNGDDNG